MTLPPDYLERVYAGVLGKLIGVYLGRPFEQWTHERIQAELGEIAYYVNERLPGRPPLVVTDDDLAGTFTFLRALPDYGFPRRLTPQQIGQTWLNYIVEGRSILWWGGLGTSTEHTAYLRLKSGIPAPRSGSRALNGQIVAEQIGAQIFIDGWAMVAPGDPGFAADLARRAASVSHDGAAVHAAQVLAAMEALAFVEADIGALLEAGLRAIPADSIIARLIRDVREWHAADGDWRTTRARLAAEYGYDRYAGPCHVVPNHALILLGLLYGAGDFHKSLSIVNTCGCDTDCNSGNLGCLLGIRGGLRALAGGPDWRGPVADRLYLSTADGGRAITDAATEALHVANAGRALAGRAPLRPKGGARFHFELPGSVQGFQAEGAARLANRPGYSRGGARSLQVRWTGRARIATPTFIPPEALRDSAGGYTFMASPTLYTGQRVRAGLCADKANAAEATARLVLTVYAADDAPAPVAGPALTLHPGGAAEIDWRVPDTGGAPIAAIGFEFEGAGAAYLDYLTWDGAPEVTLTRPAGSEAASGAPGLWRRAWVNGVDQWDPSWREPYHLVQNAGRGLLIQGTREWADYEAQAALTPALAQAFGLAARVQGMRRYYALLLCAGNVARLVKALDGEAVLAEAPFAWETWQAYDLRLRVEGQRLRAWIDGRAVFDARDTERPLEGGGVALVIEEGTLMAGAVSVRASG